MDLYDIIVKIVVDVFYADVLHNFS